MNEHTMEVMMVIQTVIFTITLIVMILQTRHLQKTVYVSSYTKMIEMLKDLRVLRIEDPSLANVYQGECQGLNDEQIKYHFFNLIVLSILELLYINRQQNLINEHTWGFWVQAIHNIAKEKSFRDMVLRKSYKIVNPDFCRIVEEIVKEADRNFNPPHQGSKIGVDT